MGGGGGVSANVAVCNLALVFCCGGGNTAFFCGELALFELAPDLRWDLLAADFPFVAGVGGGLGTFYCGHGAGCKIGTGGAGDFGRVASAAAAAFKTAEGIAELTTELVLAGFREGYAGEAGALDVFSDETAAQALFRAVFFFLFHRPEVADIRLDVLGAGVLRRAEGFSRVIDEETVQAAGGRSLGAG